MAGRTEHKYLVPNSLLDQIRSDLQPYVEADPYASEGSAPTYTVRSVYYDTPTFDCYDDKLDGLSARRKFRVRGYDSQNDESIVFLEIKRKYRDTIEKSRAPLHFRNLKAFLMSSDLQSYILTGTGTGDEETGAKRFLYHYYRQGLRPAALVVYDREPFVGKFDRSLRISFDKNLRGRLFPSLGMLFDEECLEYAMSRHVIFEVKFFRNAVPTWAQALITRYELPRMALSKYAICLDSQRSVGRAARMRSRVFSSVGNAV